MNRRSVTKSRELLLAVLLVVTIAPWSVTHAARYDVLELPAVSSELASKSLIFAIRRFGERYFAVGHRGHILYSDDGGDSWTQAEVPVRSSLLDIYFPTPELGWAVGHEGVILHSADGGKTWLKQYDGIRYGEEGKAYYEEMAAADPNNTLLPYMVEEMDFAISQGADKPLFKVRMHSATSGHALGAYGMILRTEDGGENWYHVLEYMENDSFYHVFDFTELPGERKFFLAGEAGLFMVGDASLETQGGKLIETVPWEGSFFTTVTAADDAILLGGLRGRLFRTTDVGQTWVEVEKPPTSSLVDSALLANGNLVFVSIAGEILMSTDDGNSFAKLPLRSGDRIYTVAEGPVGTLLVGGPRGIQKLSLPQLPKISENQ
ncbi:MAG: hypothetical protein DRQ98_14415 [Gammaproteobacteria bacterium]|nr:MAG: hypothetical protein DRQ98_14415 [Gammaproteobacteria bacterium]